MGTPAVTWDASYEASPAGGDDPRGADDRIREEKSTTRERAEREHGWATSEASARHGIHRAGSARASYAMGDPTTVPDGTSTRALNATDDDGRLHVDATTKKIRVYTGSAWSDVVAQPGVGLNAKIIDIGDWNMTSTPSVSVAHGLTLSKIVSISVVIRDDTDSAHYFYSNFRSLSVNITNEGIKADATNVILQRGSSWSSAPTVVFVENFTGASFDATSYNRGFILIFYTD